MTVLRVLVLGDIVGRPGRSLIQTRVPSLRQELRADMVIANSENAAGGNGITAESAREILDGNVDLLTLGDHTWERKEAKEFLQNNSQLCIRPANYPPSSPGRGWAIWQSPTGHKIGVMNLLGRVFIGGSLDCPFRTADEILAGPLKDCRVIILDMHAEATSEKQAMARYLDGKVSFVFGTHTHVQTADNRVFPNGTGYISDIGMCGPTESVLGLKTEISIKRFLTGMRHAYEVGAGPSALHGALCEINPETGKALKVERVEVWE